MKKYIKIIFHILNKYEINKLFIAFIFGSIGILSFSPYEIWIFSFLSFSGLLFLSSQINRYPSLIGLFWGLGFFGNGINWLYLSFKQFSDMSNFLCSFLILLLILYLSIYPMLFTKIQKYFIDQNIFFRLVIISPLNWLIMEFFRSYFFTGFPWLRFGYSQINGPLRGLIPIFGIDFINFLFTVINALFVFSLLQKKIKFFFVTFILLIMFIPFNYISWYQISSKKYAASIALIQANIKQSLKWNKILKNKILNTYLTMSLPFINSKSIIIWPESAVPDILNNRLLLLKNLNKFLKIKKSVIITGIVEQSKNKFYNSIIVFGDKVFYFNHKNKKYKKHHLIPFGEFIPFAKFLKKIPLLSDIPTSSFSKSSAFQSQLKFLNYKINATICYEIILGKKIRNNFKPSTNFLLNVSNDTWFGNSIGPWQHFQISKIRALELGRPLLRSTNNGITAIIKANGKIQSAISQFKTSVINKKVVSVQGITPYAKFGNLFYFNLKLIFFFIFIFKIIKNIF